MNILVPRLANCLTSWIEMVIFSLAVNSFPTYANGGRAIEENAGSTVSENQVPDALHECYDPDIPVNEIDLE